MDVALLIIGSLGLLLALAFIPRTVRTVRAAGAADKMTTATDYYTLAMVVACAGVSVWVIVESTLSLAR